MDSPSPFEQKASVDEGKAEASKAAIRPIDSVVTSPVLFWTRTRVWMRCTYCKKRHHTAFTGYHPGNYPRLYCQKPSERYTPAFPACFELDKDRGWIVNIHEIDTKQQRDTRAIETTINKCLADLTLLVGQEAPRKVLSTPRPVYPAGQETFSGDSVAINELALLPGCPLKSMFIRCPISQNIRFMKEVAVLPAWNDEDNFRTVAYLDRGEGYPDVLAISGVRPPTGELDNVLCLQNDRLDKVRALVEYMNYQIIPDPNMPYAEREYHLTHAEKQLITYFVDKHVITQGDRDKLFPFKITKTQAGNEMQSAKNLDLSLPSLALTSATIFISQPMCQNCEKFLRTVNQTFFIHLTAVVSQITVGKA